MIDLREFCGPNNNAATFEMPFVRNGYLYATDGIVCVRVPTSEKDTPATDPPAPLAPLLFEKYRCDQSKPWPTTHLALVVGVCPECGGKGTTIDEDDGSDARCFTCKGRLRFQQLRGRWLDDRMIARHYDTLIGSLPGVRYQHSNPMKGCKIGDLREITFFKFDGGEGLVMPLSLPRDGVVLVSPVEFP